LARMKPSPRTAARPVAAKKRRTRGAAVAPVRLRLDVDERRAEPESPEELMRFLSQTPILPLDGASPIELTRAVFQNK